MIFRLMLLFLFFDATMAVAEPIVLDPKGFTEITFEDIPNTKYKYADEILNIEVKRSSSALILPFDKIKQVSRLQFLWQIEGSVETKNAADEETKGGDDFPLRVGLCLAGDAPMMPFFAPAWIKKISSIMKNPSDKLIYLVVGSKHESGKKWKSPYTDSMEILAVQGEGKDGWQVIDHSFDEKLKVVGLWLMGDGDNTKSDFKVRLRSLVLE